MEDITFTAPGWHWHITPEQIANIKDRDRDTVNKVYFDNLAKFKRMAYRYCGMTKHYSFFWDCVQQIYVDMQYYDYTNCKTLFWSIRRSFYRAVGEMGWRVQSLDEMLFNDRTRSYITLIPAPEYDADRETEYEKSVKRVLQGIARQEQLNERGRDLLTARALNIPFYAGVFEHEYYIAFTR